MSQDKLDWSTYQKRNNTSVYTINAIQYLNLTLQFEITSTSDKMFNLSQAMIWLFNDLDILKITEDAKNNLVSAITRHNDFDRARAFETINFIKSNIEVIEFTQEVISDLNLLFSIILEVIETEV